MAAVVNPAAGRGRGPSIWADLAAALAARGFSTRAYVSNSPGQCAALAREAIEDGFRTIVAVGGDGTVHEVANGVLDRDTPPGARMTVVPCGTGMDFARNIGARPGPQAALQRITDGSERRIDVGYAAASERVFVNFTEMGLGAAVVARAAQLGRRWPGRLSFLLAAIRAGIEDENIPLRVEVDGEPFYEGRAVSAVVANGPYFASGMKIAPGARPDDGIFDVVVLGDFSRLELVSQIWRMYPGVHVRLGKVHWTTGRQVKIEPAEPARIDLDGELAGSGTCDVTILPGALSVLV